MRILIIKTSSLGDIVQTFPVLNLLKEHVPVVTIDWVVEARFAEVVVSHPYVDHVIQIEAKTWKKQVWKSRHCLQRACRHLRSKEYDLLIDFQGNIKSAIITLCARATHKVGYSWRCAPEWPGALFLSHRYAVSRTLTMPEQYLSLARHYFKLEKREVSPAILLKITTEEEAWVRQQQVDPPAIMVCMGSQWENKRLALQTWVVFLQEISYVIHPFFFCVWGSEQEKAEADILHTYFPDNSRVLPKMRLPVWQRLIDTMDYVCAVDSGALHLAATTSTPTFSVFGPSNAKVYKPQGTHHTAFQGECPYGVSFDKRCTQLRTCKTGACMKQLLGQDLAVRYLKAYALTRGKLR